MTCVDPFSASVDRLGRVINALQFAEGLNPAQWAALRFLARANRFSATPGALASYLNATKGTVSQTLIALEQKGLIDRVRCSEDRRVVRLALSAQGLEMLEKDPLERICSAMEGFEAEDRDRLLLVINSMTDALCRSRDGDQFGVCSSCCHRKCGEGGTGEKRVCGITGQALTEADLEKICIEYCPETC